VCKRKGVRRNPKRNEIDRGKFCLSFWVEAPCSAPRGWPRRVSSRPTPPTVYHASLRDTGSNHVRRWPRWEAKSLGLPLERRLSRTAHALPHEIAARRLMTQNWQAEIGEYRSNPGSRSDHGWRPHALAADMVWPGPNSRSNNDRRLVGEAFSVGPAIP
jgi:hypothetical protein